MPSLGKWSGTPGNASRAVGRQAWRTGRVSLGSPTVGDASSMALSRARGRGFPRRLKPGAISPRSPARLPRSVGFGHVARAMAEGHRELAGDGTGGELPADAAEVPVARAAFLEGEDRRHVVPKGQDASSVAPYMRSCSHDAVELDARLQDVDRRVEEPRTMHHAVPAVRHEGRRGQVRDVHDGDAVRTRSSRVEHRVHGLRVRLVGNGVVDVAGDGLAAGELGPKGPWGAFDLERRLHLEKAPEFLVGARLDELCREEESLGELEAAEARIAAVRDRRPRSAHVQPSEQDDTRDDAKLVDDAEVKLAEAPPVLVDEVVALVEGRERRSQEHEVVHGVAHVHVQSRTCRAAVTQQVLSCNPEPPRSARRMPYSKITPVRDDADLLMLSARLHCLVHEDAHRLEGGERRVEPALGAVAVEADDVSVVDDRRSPCGASGSGAGDRCPSSRRLAGGAYGMLSKARAGTCEVREWLERPAPAHRERLENGEDDLVAVHGDIDAERVVVDAVRVVDASRLREVQAEPGAKLSPEQLVEAVHHVGAGAVQVNVLRRQAFQGEALGGEVVTSSRRRRSQRGVRVPPVEAARLAPIDY